MTAFRDIERRHQQFNIHSLDDPSTGPDPFEAVQLKWLAYRPGYSFLQISDDLMNPPGDGYPFVSYEDLEYRDRACVLSERLDLHLRVQKAPDGFAAPLTQDALRLVKKSCRVAADIEPEDHAAAIRVVAKAYEEAVEMSGKQRVGNVKPVAARQGHLMAEGGVLNRVRGMIRDGTAYARKVSFNEPVNAFTMLYGDRIAQGGDMLSACTLEDTTAHTVKDYNGKPKTVYNTRAVSL